MYRLIDSSVVDGLCVELQEQLPEEASWANSFFKGAGKFSSLLVGDQVFKLDRRVKRYTCSVPVWVRYISFTTDDAATLKRQLTCTVFTLEGKSVEKKLTLDQKGTFAFVWFNEVVTAFEIKSDGVVNKPTLKKINVNGFDLTTFEKVSAKVADALSTKSNIDEIIAEVKAEVASVNQQALESEQRLSEANTNCQLQLSEIEQLESLKQQVEAKVALANTALSNLEVQNSQASTTLESVRNNVQQLSELSRELNEKIRREKTELETLTADKSLISDEYKDYVKEGKSQTLFYFALSLLPLLAMVLAVDKLFSGAEALLFRDYKTFSDVFAGLLLRLPFSIVLGLGMFYSWKLAEKLFSNAFKIHKDRLILARLLVIAKDTVFSSVQGLDVSDEVKFHERIRLKIELLKSHLSKELSDDFEYGKPIVVDVADPKVNDTAEAVASQNSPA